VTERGAGLSLMPDAPTEEIRAACQRLLTEPSFRRAANEFGDKVAAEAENSTVVQELELAALRASREHVLEKA
jgi:UDP:flavonoid glycosyltransferase YjiC (YdhE family)